MTKAERLEKLVRHIKLIPKTLYEIRIGSKVVAEFNNLHEANEYLDLLLKQRQEQKDGTKE